MNNYSLMPIFFSYILPSAIAVLGLFLVANHNSRSARLLAYRSLRQQQLEDIRSQVKEFALEFFRRRHKFMVAYDVTKKEFPSPESKLRLLKSTRDVDLPIRFIELNFCLSSINDDELTRQSTMLGILQTKFAECTDKTVNTGELNDDDISFISAGFLSVSHDIFRRTAFLARDNYDIDRFDTSRIIHSIYFWK